MRSIDCLLFMDDLKLYGASKDELDSLIQVERISLQDIKEPYSTQFTLRTFVVVVVIREFGACTSIYGQVSLSYF